MRRIILISVIAVLSAGLLEAQPQPPFKKRGMHFNRLEELEKIKIIEALNMDEETTLKFFARRKQHLDEQFKLIEERNFLLDEIQTILGEDKNADEKYFVKKIDQISEIEKKIVKERTSFFDSLDEIFTKEQIAKFILFEYRFKQQVREAAFKRRSQVD